MEKRTKAYILIFIIIGIILFFMAQKSILFSSIFILVSLIDLAIIIKKNNNVKSTIFLVYLIRIVMAIIYCFYGDADPDGFGLTALKYTNMNLAEYIKNVPLGAYFYSWLIGGIWKLTGEDYLLIRLINSFLSFLSCIIAYKLTKEITNSDVGKKVLLFTGFFPTLIRFSSPFASRETLFVFFSISFFYNVYMHYKNNNIKYLVKSLIYLVLSIIIHTSAITFILLYVFLYIIKNLKYKKKMLSNIIAVFLILVLFLIIFNNQIGTSKFKMGGDLGIFDKIDFVQSSSSTGRASYLPSLHTSNPILMIIYLPIRILYFMFAPFVWMCRNIMDLLGLFDGILYLLIIYKIFKNRNYIKYDNFLRGLLLSLILFICMMSLSISNYGTALRHRQKIIIPLIIVSEISKYYKKRSETD